MAGHDPKPGYDNIDRDTTAQQAAAWRIERIARYAGYAPLCKYDREE